MKVICIDNKQIPNRLTLYKEYTVLQKSTKFIWVKSDDGCDQAYREWRFITKEELRHKKIRELGL